MAGLASIFRGIWRSLVTPRSVQEIEDADPATATDDLPAPPRIDLGEQRLQEVRRKLNDIEERNRAYARLYTREREENGSTG